MGTHGWRQLDSGGKKAMKVSVALCSGKAIMLFLEGSMFNEDVESHTKLLTSSFPRDGLCEFT